MVGRVYDEDFPHSKLPHSGGGQTQLLVRFCELAESAAVCEPEYAAHLAAHRIEILAV